MPDHPLIDLINARIRAAEEAGDFDDLPGAGKPLAEEKDPQNALLTRLMRENGAEPEFVSLARELRRLREELAATGDRTARRDIMKNMSMMEARIAMAKRDWQR